MSNTLCVLCGVSISEGRLEAMPLTNVCVHCAAAYKESCQLTKSSTENETEGYMLREAWSDFQNWFNMVEVGLEDGEDHSLVTNDAWLEKIKVENDLWSNIDICELMDLHAQIIRHALIGIMKLYNKLSDENKKIFIAKVFERKEPMGGSPAYDYDRTFGSSPCLMAELIEK